MLGIEDDYTRFELAMEASGIAWWEMELPSGVVFFHENKAKMLGRKAKDFTHYTDFTNLVHKDDHQPAMDAMRQHISGAADLYEATYRIKCRDGSYKKFYDRGKIVGREGDTIRMSGFVIDVTNTKF